MRTTTGLLVGASLAGSFAGVDGVAGVDGGHVPVVPAVSPPQRVEVLDPPTVVTLTDAERATVVEQCRVSQAGTFPSVPLGEPAELLAAVREYGLDEAAVVSERVVVGCAAQTGPDGRPADTFQVFGFRSLAAGTPGAQNFLAAPTGPVAFYAAFGTPADEYVQIFTVFGRVSPEVARLVAFVDGGPSREVPIQPGGGFAGKLTWVDDVPGDTGLARLQLRAYDHAGVVVHSGPVVQPDGQPLDPPSLVDPLPPDPPPPS